MSEPPLDPRWREVRRLHRTRPRSRLLRASLGAALAGVAAAWGSGLLAPGELFTERRWVNLQRFLSQEALPEPLREGRGWAGLGQWVAEAWRTEAAAATWTTLQLALVATVLAALFGLLAAPWVARTLAHQDPYGAPEPPTRAWRWRNRLARVGCVLARALPELVLAWLLLALLPEPLWAAVLGLAIHNGGILGRLFGETLENAPRTPVAALATLGARRGHLVLGAGLPLTLPRLFAYTFYRLETCVRDATVLGVLGIASLGHIILDARARLDYDEMLLFVGFGAVIVLAADRLSHLFRGQLRDAS